MTTKFKPGDRVRNIWNGLHATVVKSGSRKKCDCENCSLIPVVIDDISHISYWQTTSLEKLP